MSNIESHSANEVDTAMTSATHINDIEHCLNIIVQRIDCLDDARINRAVGIVDGIDVGPLVKMPDGKLSYLTPSICYCDVMPFILDKVNKLHKNNTHTDDPIDKHYLECYETIPKYSSNIELLRNIVNKHLISFNLAVSKSNPLALHTTKITCETYPTLPFVLLIGLKLNKISLDDIS